MSRFALTLAALGSSIALSGAALAQPIGFQTRSIIVVGGNVSSASKVMLNPQPLPPGPCRTCTTTIGGFNRVMLNPQPLPPKVFTGTRLR